MRIWPPGSGSTAATKALLRVASFLLDARVNPSLNRDTFGALDTSLRLENLPLVTSPVTVPTSRTKVAREFAGKAKRNGHVVLGSRGRRGGTSSRALRKTLALAICYRLRVVGYALLFAHRGHFLRPFIEKHFDRHRQ